MTAWPMVAFTDVVRDVSGGNIKTPQREYRTSGVTPVIDQGKALIGGYTDEAAASCNANLPVVVFGDHTRSLKFVDFPFAMGADGVKILKPREDLDTKFLYHFLRFTDIPSAGYDRHFKYLRRLSVPLPSLPEQRRIATILDHADTLCAKRREALANLDELAQSIFIEMFGDPVANARGWRSARVGDFVRGFDSGRNIVGNEDSPGGYRVLKVSAVTSLTYREEESKPLPVEYVPPEKHLVQVGDLLFSRANTSELVGATAFVGRTDGHTALPDKLWRFQWHAESPAAPRYVEMLFQQPTFRRRVSDRATGSSGSMKNISRDKVLSLPVGLPPVVLQEKFAHRVESIDAVRTKHRAALRDIDALFASLQSRAFRGEL